MNSKINKLRLFLISLVLVTAGCTAYYESGAMWFSAGASTCTEEAVPLPERPTPTQEIFIPTPTPIGEPCSIQAFGGANVRTAPNLMADRVGTLINGASITVVTHGDGWVSITEPYGWVAGWLVSCD